MMCPITSTDLFANSHFAEFSFRFWWDIDLNISFRWSMCSGRDRKKWWHHPIRPCKRNLSGNSILHALRGCRRNYKAEQYDLKLVWARSCDEICHLFTAILHLSLAVAGEEVKRTEYDTALQFIKYFFCLRQWPSIGFKNPAQSEKVDANLWPSTVFRINDGRESPCRRRWNDDTCF